MSEEINRYTIIDSGNPSKVWNSTNGSWVMYKDHITLLESERLKNEKLRQALEEIVKELYEAEAPIWEVNIAHNKLMALKETEVK